MVTHPLWQPFELPTDAEIAAARVAAPAPTAPVEVVPADPAWPATYAALADRVRGALGDRVVAIDHVGSTAVPGLPAKPVIDIDLIVADSADEEAWVPALERDGFVLRVREPDWQEHRMMRLEEPACNLHVWSPDAVEPARHRAFRDWLRTHPEDRAAYVAAKDAAAAQGFLDAMHYNNAKAAAVYDIYERIFAADPDHQHDPQPRPTA